MKNYISTSLIVIITFVFFLSLNGCKGRGEKGGNLGGKDSTEIKSPVRYNIYVENSGSMAGYCNINDKDALETLLQDYYDRIDSNKEEEDTITLNYINTKIVTSSSDKGVFLHSIKQNCTAQ